ncbi:mannose-6-phosphate isomerase, class I [Bacillus sp. FJAT-42376]|uniref:mannose-6-phosphate isomerase, class I n=1 Tax=Bacillus sp. FJAT-42376 TaxID=2014076 RepID=UPI000F4DC06E|nr:mannose-6-phosphate isomerase, class I [Bacillus sp. FJAT-42376]AZB41683.1 mannose-6-phosphate isomerase, class I [Bacillus sp. FJAT-42376]
MHAQPLFFGPVFKERIWGGSNLASFGYELPFEQTGECWAFSAHPNGQSTVENGELAGKTLGELWEQHRELFGHLPGDRFPLLTKILDANHDLSVQVHPDDGYAMEHEQGELGKTECWYVIDCEEGAELIFGHHARTKEELEQWIDEGTWDQLLRRIPIKKGDFFYVPSGTVHALCKGSVVLETQQNSDTTYRLYDYDRRDASGSLRELHLDKSKDVITVPHAMDSLNIQIDAVPGKKVTQYVNVNHFTVCKWEIDGEAEFVQDQPFLLCSVIEGEGTLIKAGMSYRLKKGMHFLVPHAFGDFKLSGSAQLIVSHV